MKDLKKLGTSLSKEKQKEIKGGFYGDVIDRFGQECTRYPYNCLNAFNRCVHAIHCGG